MKTNETRMKELVSEYIEATMNYLGEAAMVFRYEEVELPKTKTSTAVRNLGKLSITTLYYVQYALIECDRIETPEELIVMFGVVSNLAKGFNSRMSRAITRLGLGKGKPKSFGKIIEDSGVSIIAQKIRDKARKYNSRLVQYIDMTLQCLVNDLIEMVDSDKYPIDLVRCLSKLRVPKSMEPSKNEQNKLSSYAPEIEEAQSEVDKIGAIYDMIKEMYDEDKDIKRILKNRGVL